MTDTPMLDRLAAEKHKTQIIHDFPEEIALQGIVLAKWMTHGGSSENLVPVYGRDKLLASFIGVDLDEVEREKQALLGKIRANYTGA